MIKEIQAGGKKVKVNCNAYTPIKYKMVFGKELDRDVMDLENDKKEFQGGSYEKGVKLLYVMMGQADKSMECSREGFQNFAEGLDPLSGKELAQILKLYFR